MKINFKERLIILLHHISKVPMIDIKRDLDLLVEWAYKDPGLYREVRHDILSGAYRLKGISDHPLYYLADKYGRHSTLFGSYCKVVSIVRLSTKEVARRQKQGNTPPAFDPLLRADTVPSEKVYDNIIDNAPICMNIIRDKLKEWRDTVRRGRVILLNNGSTMHHEWHGIKVTDTMSNILTYPFKEKEFSRFPNLNKLAKLINNREEGDPFVYISIVDFYDEYGGIHTLIADKDGKIREVYSFDSDVQILSKALHELFDKIARALPGNYTYSHRTWIYNLIEENWHKTKLIITTDMSKYSDTLDRAFILRILKRAGFTEDEVEELDRLYSCPVREKITHEIFSGTLASYQGQYGDFPLITIANLVMQEAVYSKMNHDLKLGYNAAVGDDTGFIFDLVDRHGNTIDIDSAFDLIVEIYGSVGVNINNLKTGKLIKGEGACDFVKINFDGSGILPHLEVNSYFKGNSDQIIRDIFDNPGFTLEQKREYLRIIYGRDISDYLMNLHKINGGLRTDEITAADVIQLIDNTWSILREINVDTHSDLVRFLEMARKEINSMINPETNRPYGLRHTALFRFRSIGDKKEDGSLYTGEEIDDNIMMNVLAIGTLGMSEDHDYLDLIGYTWGDIQQGYMYDLQGIELQDPRVAAYRTINDFFMLSGKYKEKKKGEGSNVYLSHYSEHQDQGTNTSHILIAGMSRIAYEFTSLEDWKQNVNIAINDANMNIKDAFLTKRLCDTSISRSPIKWVIGRYPVFEHNGVVYRLYEVSTKSKYPKITSDIMRKYPEIFGRFNYEWSTVARCYKI